MSSFFHDKVVIITGSSNGIGRAAAKMFIERGAKVTITGRNPATLAETKEQCIKAGATPDRICGVIGDLEHEKTAKKIVEETVAKFGSIDVLVNNAGMSCRDPTGKTGIEVGLDVFDRIMAINVRAVVALIKNAVPYLEKTRGAIVNISAVGSKPFHISAMVDGGFYAMAKAAVDRLTVQYAGELIKKGIRVNCINPGLIESDFAVKMGVTEEQANMLYQMMGNDRNCIPLGRCGKPEDIANLIVFLSDRTLTEFVVGQSIVADGGSYLIVYSRTKIAPLWDPTADKTN